MMLTLTQLANQYGTDKGDQKHEAHLYTPVYEQYMGEYRNTPVRIAEIGVNDPRFPGASLMMWDDYFTHPDARILGIDINPPVMGNTVSNRVKLITADQSSPAQMVRTSTYCPELDFIIDDGLHTFDCQINSFLALFPILRSKGVYFIEDCHAKDCAKTIELFRTIDVKTFGISRVQFSNSDKLITIFKL